MYIYIYIYVCNSAGTSYQSTPPRTTRTGIGLRYGPEGLRFLMSEVSLCLSSLAPATQNTNILDIQPWELIHRVERLSLINPQTPDPNLNPIEIPH